MGIDYKITAIIGATLAGAAMLGAGLGYATYHAAQPRLEEQINVITYEPKAIENGKGIEILFIPEVRYPHPQ